MIKLRTYNLPLLVAATYGKGFRQIKAPLGTFIQYACVFNETVIDASDTTHHSLFTKHLLENINKENIHVMNVFSQIADNVYTARHQNHKPSSINGLPNNWEIRLNDVIPGMSCFYIFLFVYYFIVLSVRGIYGVITILVYFEYFPVL